MRRASRICLICILFATAACAQSPSAPVPPLSGERALEHVRAQVAFGPRPPGSEALQKCRQYLIGQLEGYGYQVERDSFEASTPFGPKPMVNLIARKKEAAGKSIVALASHYDTKYFEKLTFVGAIDAGSSTGLLLELARVLASRKDNLDYWFVFLDGEEAFIEWSTFDGTYGSRHLAKRWRDDGTAGKVRAMILLDMIGDKNLKILKEANSTPWLMDLIWDAATAAGLSDILASRPSAVEDDHLPFLDVRIPAADIIGVDDIGNFPSWWHTEGDTLDKVSASSLEKVGRLVLEVLPAIERRLAGR